MINDERKKPSAGFWITVALIVALVAYPLSFGPACWMANRGILNHLRVADAYAPLVRFSGRYVTNKASAGLRWYGSCFAIDGSDGTLIVMEMYLLLSDESELGREKLGYDKLRWEEATSSPLFPTKK